MFRRRNRAHRPKKGDPGYQEWARARNALRTRRSIGVLVMLGMAWGLVWLVGYSPVGQQLQAQAGPVVAIAKDAWNDPRGAWMMIATALISHIGMLAYIFDEI